jgi:hypothetical protein
MPFLAYRKPNAANAFQQPCPPTANGQATPLANHLTVHHAVFDRPAQADAAYFSPVYSVALPPREPSAIPKMFAWIVPVPFAGQIS